MIYSHTFTVFTPTYNRRDKIEIVWRSLTKQSYKNFEWLIVDDGSSDGTYERVKEWQKEADFPIRYIFQNNSGKHVAFNTGVENARGELFLNADSDDMFVHDALETFWSVWNDIEEKESFSAVTALCMDSEGKIIGDKFPLDVFDSNTIEVTYSHKVGGEKWGFHKTEVLKKFPFPRFDQEKFMPEAYVWNEISRKYKTRYINRALRFYSINLDSLSSDTISLRKKSPKGTLFYYDSLNELNIPLLEKIKASVNYVRFMFHSNKVVYGYKKSKHKGMLILGLLGGVAAFIKDTLYKIK